MRPLVRTIKSVDWKPLLCGTVIGCWLMGSLLKTPASKSDWNHPNHLPETAKESEMTTAVLCIILWDDSERVRALLDTFSRECGHVRLYSYLSLNNIYSPNNKANNRNWVIRRLPSIAGLNSWNTLRFIIKDLRQLKLFESVQLVTIMRDDTAILIQNLVDLMKSSRRSGGPAHYGAFGRTFQSGFWPFPRFLELDGAGGIGLSGSALRQVSQTLNACSDSFWTIPTLTRGLSQCLQINQIPIRHSERFYPFNFHSVFNSNPYYAATIGRIFQGACCSDEAISFSRLSKGDIYLLYYGAYRLKPFGLSFSNASSHG